MRRRNHLSLDLVIFLNHRRKEDDNNIDDELAIPYSARGGTPRRSDDAAEFARVDGSSDRQEGTRPKLYSPWFLVRQQEAKPEIESLEVLVVPAEGETNVLTPSSTATAAGDSQENEAAMLVLKGTLKRALETDHQRHMGSAVPPAVVFALQRDPSRSTSMQNCTGFGEMEDVQPAVWREMLKPPASSSCCKPDHANSENPYEQSAESMCGDADSSETSSGDIPTDKATATRTGRKSSEDSTGCFEDSDFEGFQEVDVEEAQEADARRVLKSYYVASKARLIPGRPI